MGEIIGWIIFIIFIIILGLFAEYAARPETSEEHTDRLNRQLMKDYHTDDLEEAKRRRRKDHDSLMNSSYMDRLSEIKKNTKFWYKSH